MPIKYTIHMIVNNLRNIFLRVELEPLSMHMLLRRLLAVQKKIP